LISRLTKIFPYSSIYSVKFYTLLILKTGFILLQSLSSKEISRKHFPTQEITLHNFLNNTASLYRFAQFLSNLAATSKLLCISEWLFLTRRFTCVYNLHYISSLILKITLLK